jgi:hypothetical protein
MVMKDIEFSVDGSDGKKIDMIYMVGSRQLFIWLDKNLQPKPAVLEVDYMDMAKTKDNFCQVFNGSGNGNDGYVISAWAKFSDLVNPCMYEYYKNQEANANDNANDNGNGNGDGLTDEYAESLNRASNRTIPKFEEEELAEIPNRDYPGFIINAIKREVKRDDVLIRQIFYTAMSAYTFEPINLGIISPTSEGKTYTTMKVVQYFPKDDVWLIGNMSDKALIRQRGILINSKGESIQKQIDELDKKLRNMTIADCRLRMVPPNADLDRQEDEEQGEPKMTFEQKVKQKFNQEKAETKNELDNLLKDAIRLINLQGKILVFLEPPSPKLWDLIKPILSHDNVEITFDYVATNERGTNETQKVTVRGWPAVIFCSAKDESGLKIWPEIQSRFLITSPNINQDKVHDGNILLAQRKFLPNAMQEQLIISGKERELAKKAVSYLKRWMHNLFESNGMDYEHRNAVWVPYYKILANALKSDRGRDNRVNDRIFSLLTMIPLTKVTHRPNLVYGKERLVIGELADLSEALHISQNVSGIPTHKLKFYKEIFLPLYESKTKPDPSKDGDKVEDRKAVTTSQLSEYYKSKTGKSITTANIQNTYLIELENNGFIDKQDSDIDKRKKIYFPIMDISKDENIEKLFNEDALNNFLQPNKIIPSKYFKKIPENWLELEISELKNYLVDKSKFQLIDENDDEISVPEFVKNYSKHLNLTKYFVEPEFSNNHNEIKEGMKLLYGDELE